MQDEIDQIVSKAVKMYDTRATFILMKPVHKCHDDIDKMNTVELKHRIERKKQKRDPAKPSKLTEIKKIKKNL